MILRDQAVPSSSRVPGQVDHRARGGQRLGTVPASPQELPTKLAPRRHVRISALQLNRCARVVCSLGVCGSTALGWARGQVPGDSHGRESRPRPPGGQLEGDQSSGSLLRSQAPGAEPGRRVVGKGLRRGFFC